MNELDILSGRIGIETTYLKVKTSLEEIKLKHGDRLDVINSMERTLVDLQMIKLSYDAMEKELRSALQQSFRLERLVQEEKFKVRDLETQLKMKDATL